MDYLNGLLPFLGASTMYYEGGEAALPVLETPLHGASCIQEMLLQSWGNRIRVFPAMPKKWGSVCFDDLRAEGAFLVSAFRSEGKTAWVRIKSLAGERCFLQVDIEEPLAFQGHSRVDLHKNDDGLYELPLYTGEDIILLAASFSGPIVTAPVESRDSRKNIFGIKRGN